MPVFAPIDEAELVRLVRLLAAALAADAAWHPTCLVGIGRGGLVPAVYLSHAVGVPLLTLDFSAADEALCAPAAERLSRRARAGERLLLIDDINDSGRTVAALRRLLAAPADAVRFATLIDNVGSAARVDYAARRIDRATEKAWFVFPWEALAPPAALEADAAELPERTA